MTLSGNCVLKNEKKRMHLNKPSIQGEEREMHCTFFVHINHINRTKEKKIDMRISLILSYCTHDSEERRTKSSGSYLMFYFTVVACTCTTEASEKTRRKKGKSNEEKEQQKNEEKSIHG
jgi:hypothetical protein